ncbi:MAG TPA: PTS fructose transporter subunit IIA [Hyphomonadaceae bacterium]|nr:PTS fructose transporter subunit IIA [Hyphomonadaceae bacterium]
MIGVLIVSHGRLAAELVAAAVHVMGPQSCFRAFAIEPDDDPTQKRDEILAAARDCECGDGVILLTDMFGGTPSNLAHSILRLGRFEVISGVNLPMLITLAQVRKTHGLEEAAKAAMEAGRQYITLSSSILARPNRSTDSAAS